MLSTECHATPRLSGAPAAGRRLHWFNAVCILLLATTAVAEDTWPAFRMDWAHAGPSAVDLSDHLEAKAGGAGFITVRNGHLARPDGARFRIWGVNLTGGACFPGKKDAPQYARFLARFGINCVRFHFLDSNWGAEATLFDRGREDTQGFNPEQLDRFDFFVSELKRRGIYCNINLNVGRVYRKADGVRDHDQIGFGKALQYFDPRIQALHREYARALLCHRNPYTGKEYRHEPAVAIVELVNENSIVESWFAGRLQGNHHGPSAGTWSDITPYYAEALTDLYNTHLKRELSEDALQRLCRTAGVSDGAPIPRLRPQQFEQADAERFALEARFYMELEDGYFQMMYRLLHHDLGVKALVAATSDHNHWKSGYPLLQSAAKLDLVDGHVYWQHPSRIVDAATGKRSFRIGNTPMVDDPLNSTAVQLARSAVAGKPYTVSETNHPFPNEYACEGIPILAAYALLQDWDGIFWYTLAHDAPGNWQEIRPGHFDIAPDPVKMTGLAIAGRMFLRGDVEAARQTVPRAYAPEDVVESLRLDSGRAKPLFTPGFSPALCLMHRTTISSFSEPPSPYPAVEAGHVITSDTGQLRWQHGKLAGLVSVQSDRTEGFIGHAGGGIQTGASLSVEMDTPFCSVLLTSLDDRPLDRSRRMLLTTTARSTLDGMQWNEERKGLDSWGALPMRIEPVRGTVILRGAPDGGSVRAYPLDGAGNPGAVPCPASQSPAGWRIELGEKPSPWYLVERE